MQWKCGEKTFDLSRRIMVMGILNVTPDSFSDGGQHYQRDVAVQHAMQMVEDGADIIDIGGESTRPGAEPVSLDDELKRTIPVIEAIRKQSDVAISIDTMKSQVARRAVEAGADIINDVSAMTHDEEMQNAVAESKAGLILMHMQGKPQTMQRAPSYRDVVSEVHDYLASRVEMAEVLGIHRNRIALDPGIGFGKTLDHNLLLMHRLDSLSDMGLPVMIAISRKSFIGTILDVPVEERLEGTIAANLMSITKGARIIRVHDVKANARAVRIAEAIMFSTGAKPKNYVNPLAIPNEP